MSEYQYAGFWRRALAAAIDTAILWIPVSIFKWMFAGQLNERILFVLDNIQFFLIWAIYYAVLESSAKQGTCGKQLLGLRVITIDGQRPNVARAVLRYFLGIIVAIPLGLGIFMAGWTKQKQGLHDIISGCLVIRAESS